MKKIFGRLKSVKLITVILIIVTLIFGIHMLAVNADSENEMTITFEDSVLCSKVANELRAYKNSESERAVNYLVSSTDKTVTINRNNLQNIKKLNLSGSSSGSTANQITDLSGINNFIYLEELVLDNNSRISTRTNSESNIHEIYKLTNLITLSLAGTSIYNEDIYSTSEPNNISRLTKLQELNMSSTNLSSTGLKSELNGLNSLRKLNLSNNQNINNLSEITEKIVDLNIDNTGITDIEVIKSFSKLEKLSIGHNSISNISYLYETHQVTVVERR